MLDITSGTRRVLFEHAGIFEQDGLRIHILGIEQYVPSVPGTKCLGYRGLKRRHGFIMYIIPTRRLQGFGAPVAFLVTDADFEVRVYQSNLLRRAADGEVCIFGKASMIP